MKTQPIKIFVQLGRLGDILNVLPLAKQHFDATGVRPYIQVAAEFATALDGVTYALPLIWAGPWDRPLAAMLEARRLTEDVVLCQIHGVGIMNPHRTTSFAREAWVSAGASVPWGSLPLVIDKRDSEREKLLAPLYREDQPLILFSGKGNSSPFPHAKALLQALQIATRPGNFLSGVTLLDLSDVRAERFTDFLTLFERAECLISIDTAHLHLAPAVQTLPVIALCTRDPSEWHGTPWRKEHVARFFYDEFPARIPDVLTKVRDILPEWRDITDEDGRAIGRTLFDNPGRRSSRIVHVWADWRTTPTAESDRRAAVAQASWLTEYATGRWIPHEVTRRECVRDGLDIGDPHNVNFVHDTIRVGLDYVTRDDDIIALTNADIGFTPGLTGRVLAAVERFGAVFTHRRDFKRIDKPFVSEAEVRLGEFYPGTDAVFFSVHWWREHASEYADFLMGREYWDEVFRQLIKYHGGRGLDFAVWHEWHESFWSSEGRWTMAGNVHNRELRREWFEKTGLQPEDYRFWQTTDEQARHPKPYPDEPDRGP